METTHRHAQSPWAVFYAGRENWTSVRLSSFLICIWKAYVWSRPMSWLRLTSLVTTWLTLHGIMTVSQRWGLTVCVSGREAAIPWSQLTICSDLMKWVADCTSINSGIKPACADSDCLVFQIEKVKKKRKEEKHERISTLCVLQISFISSFSTFSCITALFWYICLSQARKLDFNSSNISECCMFSHFINYQQHSGMCCT